MTVEELRSPDGWSWVYDCHHGHVRKHLAMVGRWCVASGWPAELMAEEASGAPATEGSGLTIEAIVAVDSPREFRIHPRDRTSSRSPPKRPGRVSSSRCRCGAPGRPRRRSRRRTRRSATRSGHPTADASRSCETTRSGSSRPTVRDSTRVVAKPGGGREPRWSPDGRRLAFVSRRRGWSQVWLIDAPVPRRGRPQREPQAAGADGAHDQGGFDVDGLDVVAGRIAARRDRPTGAR